MKIAPSPRIVSRTLAAIVALTLAAGTATAAGDVYYERAFVRAAQDKCRLFEPRLTQALEAATLQARGAALRAGRPATELAATAGRAKARAAATPCNDAELDRVKTRVRHAFAGWSRAARINFPGDRAGWSADRFESARDGWRLFQDGATGASPVRFGLTGRAPQDARPAAVVSFVGKPRPYAARIVMRDTARSPRPWLGTDGLPPEAARRAVFAAGSDIAPRDLLASGARAGEVWRFPDSAAEALAALDPREPFLIEFLFRDDSVATARFEAGDFAAARAFLAMGPV
ncbi:Uncharacterised protein [Brevundimonas diminuta]|uniref:hypothetical protein n=1 Tax=Brevundimonas diminuta TaxID=293 RepID=UPI000B4E798C|nr:hypothetical protein [Brevundimonas diminuta]MBD3819747.1 hypothetical protein [Brevundimonas diminuta]OWR19871.1 hypothetical protein CD944_08845 [Brevundimonas diminuta]WQE45797.1 hypothetical protein U0020_02835 [Brevundimonas diminuta]SPU47412.1 Uncharacterised protein [Brevundimonas diminuta]SUW15023.1 Uncharacterised protein [Brevundimonas diminuta]